MPPRNAADFLELAKNCTFLDRKLISARFETADGHELKSRGRIPRIDLNRYAFGLHHPFAGCGAGVVKAAMTHPDSPPGSCTYHQPVVLPWMTRRVPLIT
jgi:hypothetical protein